MKRGNTALKRGLGLASVFALAIAGAVVAAPAANAAPTAADSIRATPTADANYVNSDGTASTTYLGNGTYSATTPTGTAKIIKPGSSQQVASDFQVVLSGTWTPGNLTVTLPAKVTWAAPPVVSVDSTERALTGFDTSAGFDGTNAHVAPAVTGGTALAANTVSQPTVVKAGGVNTNVINVPITGGTAPTGGYLLSFHGVIVNTTAVTAADLAAGSLPVSATLAGGLGVAGATTLGYVSPVSLSASNAAAADADGNVTLPDIVVTENVAGALTSAGDLKLTISASPDAAVTIVTDTSKAKATATGTGLGVVSAVTAAANVATVDVTSPSTAAGSVTVSGIQVANVDKNATIKVALTAPSTAGSAADAGTDFAFAPDLVAASVSVTTTAPEPRIAGSDRYDTAAKILNQGIADSVWTVTTTNAVVIANGETFKQGVDALAANFLADAKSAPILLTEANSLPVSTQAGLIKLFKGFTGGDITVYVMGKTDSVSASVRAQIKSIVTSTAALTGTNEVKVVEVAGDNRYQTSAASATQAGAAALDLHSLTTTGAWLRTAFLASGTVNADALAAGSVSASAGIPVLLTNGTTLDSKVSAAIKDLGIQQVIVLGATDRVSAALVDSLKDLGVTSTKRIAGTNRYETSADLYTWAFSAINPTTGTDRGLGWAGDTAYIANGTDGFPDALSVGPLAAAGDNPILTTAVDKLSAGVATFLKTNKADFTGGFWALGQTDRISSAVITAVQDALK